MSSSSTTHEKPAEAEHESILGPHSPALPVLLPRRVRSADRLPRYEDVPVATASWDPYERAVRNWGRPGSRGIGLHVRTSLSRLTKHWTSSGRGASGSRDTSPGSSPNR